MLRILKGNREKELLTLQGLVGSLRVLVGSFLRDLWFSVGLAVW